MLRRLRSSLLLASAAAAVMVLASSQLTPAAAQEGEVRVSVRDVRGAGVGTVTLAPVEGGVRVEASFTGLQPGFHGFHVHDVGVCDPAAPDGPFTSAGGHYTGSGGAHGGHAGDLPSLLVTARGTAHLSTVTDAFTLDALRAGDGAAVMLHAGPDNFANIPDRYTSATSGLTGPDDATLRTGDSGDRIACGTLPPAGAPGAETVTVPSRIDTGAGGAGPLAARHTGLCPLPQPRSPVTRGPRG